MGIQRHHTVAVVHHHIVAIATGVIGCGGDHAGQRRTDRRTRWDGDVDAGVPSGLACERIAAVAELRGDPALSSGAHRRAEAIRTDEGDTGAGDPSLCAGGSTIPHQVINAVGIAALLLGDNESQSCLDI